MNRPIVIRTDDPDEDWGDLLRELESRCAELAEEESAERQPRAPVHDDPWTTESGEPIDPIDFFVTFTGLE